MPILDILVPCLDIKARGFQVFLATVSYTHLDVYKRQGIYSEKDLGPLADYIDYERYGHDIAYDEQGRFTDEGYVRVASERWDRQFNGELDDIPDEYRITGSCLLYTSRCV